MRDRYQNLQMLTSFYFLLPLPQMLCMQLPVHQALPCIFSPSPKFTFLLRPLCPSKLSSFDPEILHITLPCFLSFYIRSTYPFHDILCNCLIQSPSLLLKLQFYEGRFFCLLFSQHLGNYLMHIKCPINTGWMNNLYNHFKWRYPIPSGAYTRVYLIIPCCGHIGYCQSFTIPL